MRSISSRPFFMKGTSLLLATVLVLCLMIGLMPHVTASEGGAEEEARTYCFLGSSVTQGSLNQHVSFVDMMAVDYPQWELIKEGAGGTTLVDLDERSYIQRMLHKIPTDKEIDHFICQLSTNDASKELPMGQISASKEIEDFDTSTILGGMEFIIAYASQTWDCPVSFYTGPDFGNAQYDEMVVALYALQEKWGIGIIDFYNYANMEALSQETLASYMRKDLIHPLDDGYRWMAEETSKYLITYESVQPFLLELKSLSVESITIDDAQAITDLRQQYDGLSDYERYFIDEASVASLIQSEEAIMAIEKAIEEARLAAEAEAAARQQRLMVIIGVSLVCLLVAVLGWLRYRSKSTKSI